MNRRYAVTRAPNIFPRFQADVSGLADSDLKAWKDIWSAGHGVATIHDVPTVAELAQRIAQEYRAACAVPISAALA